MLCLTNTTTTNATCTKLNCQIKFYNTNFQNGSPGDPISTFLLDSFNGHLINYIDFNFSFFFLFYLLFGFYICKFIKIHFFHGKLI